jgi:hypothetical protein
MAVSSSILIWSKTTNFIKINEGTGDNLLAEDRENGYVDYINFSFAEYDGDDLVETDGGMYLLEEYYQDMFNSVEEVIKYLTESADIPNENYIVLYHE